MAEYAARQSEINTTLEFKELQKQEEVILDENALDEVNEEKCELEDDFAVEEA